PNHGQRTAGGVRVQLHGARRGNRNSIQDSNRPSAARSGFQPEFAPVRGLRRLHRGPVIAVRPAEPEWHARARAQAGPHQPVPVPLLDRTGVLMNVWIFLIALSIACQAEIIDRIAVVVGSSIITESEIVREIRLTSLLN